MGNILSFNKDTAGSNGSQDQGQLIEDYVTITNNTSSNKQSAVKFDLAKALQFVWALTNSKITTS